MVTACTVPSRIRSPIASYTSCCCLTRLNPRKAALATRTSKRFAPHRRPQPPPLRDDLGCDSQGLLVRQGRSWWDAEVTTAGVIGRSLTTPGSHRVTGSVRAGSRRPAAFHLIDGAPPMLQCLAHPEPPFREILYVASRSRSDRWLHHSGVECGPFSYQAPRQQPTTSGRRKILIGLTVVSHRHVGPGNPGGARSGHRRDFHPGGRQCDRIQHRQHRAGARRHGDGCAPAVFGFGAESRTALAESA